jgi:eukaryotic-like serine/threonine-protein kinase
VTPAADPRSIPLRDSLVGRALVGSAGVTYHLRDSIGEGGQGWVFRANWDDPSGHVVIVKVLRPDAFGPEALRRFHREAQVLRMLSTQGHPNPYIVRFFDHAVAQVPSPFGKEPLTLPFTVLEYVDGTTLEKVLEAQNGRGLAPERVRRLLRQICQALDIVHGQKVVHRDLKPSNILLATEAGIEVAKVTDFGLVKLVDVNLHRTAALAGASLGYAPPEQYEQGNERVTERTDVFSLAAVVYEMLAGRPAFPFTDGENPLLIVTRILNGPRPSLMRGRNALAPELETQTALTEALDRELSRAMAADPSVRHESVMDLWSALEGPLRAAAEERPVVPRAISPFDATARLPGDGRAAPVGSGIQIRASAPPFSAAAVARPTPLPAGSGRVPETRAAMPASWSWSVLGPPLKPQALRAGCFFQGGEGVIAVGGPTGLFRWIGKTWVPLAVPGHLPQKAVRGARTMHDGAVLVFGEGGLVARVAPSGTVARWRVPDDEIIFSDALIEENGTTTLVGERPYRGTAPRSVAGTTAGVVAQFSGDRITVIGEAVQCARLRGVARLTTGQLVACGDWGALVRIELGVVENIGTICGGHLVAIAPLPGGGAVTVGAGGHALSLSPKLDAQLEAVQTTRDLLSLTTTEDGQAWAGSAQARLLRRATNGPAASWIRMSGDIGVSSSMIALWAGPRSLRALGDDGAVVEGHIA